MMTKRERLSNTFNFKPVDSLPAIEWAGWWDVTMDRWHKEGFPYNIDSFEYLGLDQHAQFWLSHTTNEFPHPEYHGGAIINNEKDYDNIKKYLFPKDAVKKRAEELHNCKEYQSSGDMSVWITFEGFFWFPRVLFGIENHLYSFYDHPELYHRICSDLVEFQLEMLEQFCDILTPDFMSFAEDMSYNSGPMLSKTHFDEFLAPYYKRIIPAIKEKGIKVLIDTDGDVYPLIPWLKSVDVDGIMPLERQSGVDVNLIREQYPDLLMLGGFNKLIMKDGEDAMRKEFERILPAMKSGGYIPSVDHQTPPDVSLENYKIYVKLLKEYCTMKGS